MNHSAGENRIVKSCTDKIKRQKESQDSDKS